MSEIKTYDLEDTGRHECFFQMVEDKKFKDGEWVKHEDYKELEKENAELKVRWNKLKNNFNGEAAGMYGNYHNIAKIMEDMEESNDE